MKCLVTKLNGGENNPNLEFFDELGVTFQTSSSDGRIELIYSDWMDGNVIRAEEPVYIAYYENKNAAILTDEYLIPSGFYKHFYIWPATTNTDYTVYLPKRAMLTTLERNGSIVSISNFDTLRTMQSLAVLRPAGCNVDYDVIGSNVLGDYAGMGEGSKISLDKVSDGVTIINCDYDIISGSLYSLRDKTSLTGFWVRKPQKSSRITGSIEYLPLNSLLSINIGNNSSINGSITHFNNSAVTTLLMNNSAVSGSINNLPITLVRLEVYGTTCSGDIKTLADNQVAAGRTSGTLTVQSSGNIKNNGTAYTGNKTITFSGGSYTIS